MCFHNSIFHTFAPSPHPQLTKILHTKNALPQPHIIKVKHSIFFNSISDFPSQPKLSPSNLVLIPPIARTLTSNPQAINRLAPSRCSFDSHAICARYECHATVQLESAGDESPCSFSLSFAFFQNKKKSQNLLQARF